MCMPATPWRPWVASTASTARSMTSGLVVRSVGSQTPVPPCRCAATIAISAASVGSLVNSTPSPPLTYRSINAGQAMHSLSQDGAASTGGSLALVRVVMRSAPMRSASPRRICRPSNLIASRSHRGPDGGAVISRPGQQHGGTSRAARVAEPRHGESGRAAGDPTGIIALRGHVLQTGNPRQASAQHHTIHIYRALGGVDQLGRRPSHPRIVRAAPKSPARASRAISGGDHPAPPWRPARRTILGPDTTVSKHPSRPHPQGRTGHSHSATHLPGMPKRPISPGSSLCPSTSRRPRPYRVSVRAGYGRPPPPLRWPPRARSTCSHSPSRRCGRVARRSRPAAAVRSPADSMSRYVRSYGRPAQEVRHRGRLRGGRAHRASAPRRRCSPGAPHRSCTPYRHAASRGGERLVEQATLDLGAADIHAAEQALRHVRLTAAPARVRAGRYARRHNVPRLQHPRAA